jgi:hypothetical protein
MATTREELESFHQYAACRLKDGGSEPSLDDLLTEWADSRDREAINEAIRRGLADVAAGQHEPADQAMEQIRREFGLPEE